MTRRLALLILAAALPISAAKPAPQATAAKPDSALQSAIAASTRTPANVARDPYRHPYETLRFFGVRPGDTVVEIWPGGGWYTEILAPYLAAGGGKLYAATPDWGLGGLNKLKAASPTLYGNIAVADFPAFETNTTRIPDGSADVVLTFRNVHNWRMGYHRDDKQDYSAEAFRQIYAMLRPGGVLGVVDHRLPENANPKDSADWPDGVWTLPPSFKLKDVDRAKYAAIGESDRMTLKFVKPR